MGKKYVSIVLLTALLLFIMLLGGIWEKMDQDDLTVVVTVGDHTEEIKIWHEPYKVSARIFLPGYADLSQVYLKAERSGLYQVNGVAVDTRLSCENLLPDQRYPITRAEAADLRAESLIIRQSQNIGALFLDVKSGDMDYIHEKKENTETAVIRLYDAQGQLNYSGDVEEISGRGQSTWFNEKKSYNMDLTLEADLLGMGMAQRWVLQANSADTTNIRNKMVYDFAAAAGMPYTPQCQWVDLYLNGEYAGVYLLCERIEVHPERVDIPEAGSFLVTKDWEWRFEAQGNTYIQTNSKAALRIRHGDMTIAQLQSIWQSAENAILAEDGIDPVTGKSWQDLIDMESWANKILIEEIFGNTDGVSLSQYFYLDGSRQDGRICAGPVWDYDLTMGKEPNRFYTNKAGVYGSHWYYALFQKTEFMDCLRQQYAQVFRPLLQKLAFGGMEEYVQFIAAASDCNSDRWESYGVQEDIERMRLFLQQRMELLDYIWLEQGEYITVQLHTNQLEMKVFILKPGELLPELYVEENYVWCCENTDEPVDLEKPVYENMILHLVYQQPETESAEAPAEPEVMENPDEPGAALVDPPDAERVPFRRWAPGAVFCVVGITVVAAECLRRRRDKGKKRSGHDRSEPGQRDPQSTPVGQNIEQ